MLTSLSAGTRWSLAVIARIIELGPTSTQAASKPYDLNPRKVELQPTGEHPGGNVVSTTRWAGVRSCCARQFLVSIN